MQKSNGLIWIPLEHIEPSPLWVRTFKKDDAFYELVASIQRLGIIEPIVVRKKNGNHEIIGGHRRYYAAELAKLVEIPCIVKKMTDEEALDVQIAENTQREDLSDFEIGKLYKMLIDNYGYTQDTLGKKVNKTQGYISQRLKLLEFQQQENITPVIMTDATERQWRAIDQLPKDQKKEVIQEIKDTGEIPRVKEIEQKKEILTMNGLIRKGDIAECPICRMALHKDNAVKVGDVLVHRVTCEERARQRLKLQEAKPEEKGEAKRFVDKWDFRKARMQESPSPLETDFNALIAQDQELSHALAPYRFNEEIPIISAYPDLNSNAGKISVFYDGTVHKGDSLDRDAWIVQQLEKKGFRVKRLDFENDSEAVKKRNLKILREFVLKGEK